VLTSPASPETTAARTSALLVASGFLPLQGQVDLAKAILRDVKPTVEMLASTNPILPARYYRSHAICAMATSDVDGFLAGARDAAERFAAIGDKRNELAQRGNVVYALLEVGDHESAAREGTAVVEEAERLGLRNVVALAKQNAGYALVRSGKDEDGRRMLGEAAAEFSKQGHARMLGGTHIYLANAHLSAGRIQDALEEIEAALASLASAPPLRAYALAVLARIDLKRGDLARAGALADEALALLDSLGGVDAGETEVYLAAAEAKLAAGDQAGAKAVLRRGRERLLARAARLDEAHRAMFLGNVGANVALLALAARTLD
jgi:tetratricopeptide (TPR) repeat protein